MEDSCKVCQQSLVGFDPSIVSKMNQLYEVHLHALLVKSYQSFSGLSIGFAYIYVIDKSFAQCKVPIAVNIC